MLPHPQSMVEPVTLRAFLVLRLRPRPQSLGRLRLLVRVQEALLVGREQGGVVVGFEVDRGDVPPVSAHLEFDGDRRGVGGGLG